MTIQEINSNIDYNEKLIAEYSGKKRAVQKQIEESELLLCKYSTLSKRFENKQSQRKSILKHITSDKLRNRTMQRYFVGMEGLLDGNEYQETREGLCEAQHRIKVKIIQLDTLIDEYDQVIRYRKERREYWKAQLKLVVEGEV